MQSNKFLRVAREVAERDYGTFNTLMEFERTKKIRTKDRMNFTIDKNVADHFKKFCRENGFNMSAKVQQMMERLVEDSKKKGYEKQNITSTERCPASELPYLGRALLHVLNYLFAGEQVCFCALATDDCFCVREAHLERKVDAVLSYHACEE